MGNFQGLSQNLERKAKNVKQMNNEGNKRRKMEKYTEKKGARYHEINHCIPLKTRLILRCLKKYITIRS